MEKIGSGGTVSGLVAKVTNLWTPPIIIGEIRGAKISIDR